VDTCVSALLDAEPGRIYQLAAAVEDWPRLLPHYRWVHIISTESAGRRIVEMAARREVLGPLGIPLWWQAVQTLIPQEPRIEFVHVAGATRGMQVTWRIEPSMANPGKTLVQIRHVFAPRWPIPDGLIRAVVGEYFVNGVARRTLAHLADRTQRPS
jgi:ribosome-associated toxin RatA of RatAB toxin-antitoxin module